MRWKRAAGGKSRARHAGTPPCHLVLPHMRHGGARNVADRSRSHQRRRARAVAPRSPEAQEAPLPRVVGALLSGQLEEVLLSKAAAGVARIELVHDRLALLDRKCVV